MSVLLSDKPSRERIYFLDYLRDFIMLQVILWHATAIYGTRIRYRWFFQDQETAVLFDVIALISELYMMPIMLFVAGYLTTPSFDRHGPRRFLTEKTKHMWVPFIFGVACTNPINFYLNRVVLGTTQEGYFRYWFGTYFLQDVNPAHLWFLYILFFFYLVYVVIRLLQARFSSAVTPLPHCEPTTVFLILFALCTAALTFVLSASVGYNQWLYFLGIKLFGYQPSRLGLNLAFFFLGVYAYRRNWRFDNASWPRILGWASIAGLASLMMLVFRAKYGKTVDDSVALAFWNSLLHCAVTISVFGAAAYGLKRLIDRPSKVLHVITVNSFAVYIIHQPIVVWLEYLLLSIRMSCYAKAVIVYGLGLALSLVISHYVVRRLPVLRNVL